MTITGSAALCALAVGLASSLAVGQAAAAAQETVISSFKGVSARDGSAPASRLLMDKTGALYGTTVDGGSGACFSYYYDAGPYEKTWEQRSKIGCGTVFKLTPPSAGKTVWTRTVLADLSTTASYPAGNLVADKTGALYGTTLVGGSSNLCQLINHVVSGDFSIVSSVYRTPGCGAIFKLTPPAAGKTVWTRTILHEFAGGTDGAFPQELTIGADGALYGTTIAGGKSNCANPPSALPTIPYPVGSTIYDLRTGGCGTVFKLTPPATGQTVWTETVLHRFAGNDGQAPFSGLVMDAAGALYGTTSAGGGTGAFGTVFKLTPSGSSSPLEVLHRFKGGNDGSAPAAGLAIDKAGALYGTTTYGGGGCTNSSANASGCGTAFELSPPAGGHTVWVERMLVRFGGGYPVSGLTFDKNGNLYGTAAQGASHHQGGVYRVTPPPTGHTVWRMDSLRSFLGSPDGAVPLGAPIVSSTGVVFGTTSQGGADKAGAVYQITP